MSYVEWPEEELIRVCLQRFGTLEKLQIEYILSTATNSANPKRFLERKIQTRNLFESRPGYVSTVPIGKPNDSIIDAFWLVVQYITELNPLDTWVERDGIGFLINNKQFHAVKVPYGGEYTMQYVNREATDNDSYIFILEDLGMMYNMPTIKPDHSFALIERSSGQKYPKFSYYSLDKASKEG